MRDWLFALFWNYSGPLPRWLTKLWIWRASPALRHKFLFDINANNAPGLIDFLCRCKGTDISTLKAAYWRSDAVYQLRLAGEKTPAEMDRHERQTQRYFWYCHNRLQHDADAPSALYWRPDALWTDACKPTSEFYSQECAEIPNAAYQPSDGIDVSTMEYPAATPLWLT